MTDEFLTPEMFMVTIEAMVKEKSINHIDAVLLYCQEHDMDVEDVVPLIKRAMKEKIKVAAMDTGLMRKEGTLPI